MKKWAKKSIFFIFFSFFFHFAVKKSELDIDGFVFNEASRGLKKPKFELENLKEVVDYIKTRTIKNLISESDYIKSARFLKESLCFYKLETGKELELSEMIEAFIFSVFDYEKKRSTIDYLITDLKTPDRRFNAESLNNSHQNGFDIFTVKEVSSQLEDDIKTKSKSGSWGSIRKRSFKSKDDELELLGKPMQLSGKKNLKVIKTGSLCSRLSHSPKSSKNGSEEEQDRQGSAGFSLTGYLPELNVNHLNRGSMSPMHNNNNGSEVVGGRLGVVNKNSLSEDHLPVCGKKISDEILGELDFVNQSAGPGVDSFGGRGATNGEMIGDDEICVVPGRRRGALETANIENQAVNMPNLQNHQNTSLGGSGGSSGKDKDREAERGLNRYRILSENADPTQKPQLGLQLGKSQVKVLENSVELKKKKRETQDKQRSRSKRSKIRINSTDCVNENKKMRIKSLRIETASWSPSLHRSHEDQVYEVEEAQLTQRGADLAFSSDLKATLLLTSSVKNIVDPANLANSEAQEEVSMSAEKPKNTPNYLTNDFNHPNTSKLKNPQHGAEGENHQKSQKKYNNHNKNSKKVASKASNLNNINIKKNNSSNSYGGVQQGAGVSSTSKRLRANITRYQAYQNMPKSKIDKLLKEKNRKLFFEIFENREKAPDYQGDKRDVRDVKDVVKDAKESFYQAGGRKGRITPRRMTKASQKGFKAKRPTHISVTDSHSFYEFNSHRETAKGAKKAGKRHLRRKVENGCNSNTELPQNHSLDRERTPRHVKSKSKTKKTPKISTIHKIKWSTKTPKMTTSLIKNTKKETSLLANINSGQNNPKNGFKWARPTSLRYEAFQHRYQVAKFLTPKSGSKDRVLQSHNLKNSHYFSKNTKSAKKGNSTNLTSEAASKRQREQKSRKKAKKGSGDTPHSSQRQINRQSKSFWNEREIKEGAVPSDHVYSETTNLTSTETKVVESTASLSIEAQVELVPKEGGLQGFQRPRTEHREAVDAGGDGTERSHKIVSSPSNFMGTSSKNELILVKDAEEADSGISGVLGGVVRPQYFLKKREVSMNVNMAPVGGEGGQNGPKIEKIDQRPKTQKITHLQILDGKEATKHSSGSIYQKIIQKKLNSGPEKTTKQKKFTSLKTAFSYSRRTHSNERLNPIKQKTFQSGGELPEGSREGYSSNSVRAADSIARDPQPKDSSSPGDQSGTGHLVVQSKRRYNIQALSSAHMKKFGDSSSLFSLDDLKRSIKLRPGSKDSLDRIPSSKLSAGGQKLEKCQKKGQPANFFDRNKKTSLGGLGHRISKAKQKRYRSGRTKLSLNDPNHDIIEKIEKTEKNDSSQQDKTERSVKRIKASLKHISPQKLRPGAQHRLKKASKRSSIAGHITKKNSFSFTKPHRSFQSSRKQSPKFRQKKKKVTYLAGRLNKKRNTVSSQRKGQGPRGKKGERRSLRRRENSIGAESCGDISIKSEGADARSINERDLRTKVKYDLGLLFRDNKYEMHDELADKILNLIKQYKKK